MIKQIEEYIKLNNNKKAIFEINKLNNIDDYLLCMFFKQEKKPEYEDVENIEKIIKNKQNKYSDIYFELGKFYLNINNNKAIEYIEKYINLCDDILNIEKSKVFLLVKLYYEIGCIDRSYDLLIKIGCDTEEEQQVMINLIVHRDSDISKIMHGFELLVNKNKKLDLLFERIVNEKVLIDMADSKKWLEIVINNLNKLDSKNKLKINQLMMIYYRNKKNIYKFIEVYKDIIKIDNDKCKEYFYEAISVLKEVAIKDRNFAIKQLVELSELCNNLKIKNIFLNKAEILEKKLILKSRPIQLTILVTMKCNLRCIMCCNGYDVQYELDNDLYNYIVDNMPYLEKIEWKGGEVFLYKDFNNLLELANKYGVSQTIVTNGLLLDKDKIDFLINNKVNLTISIDDVTETAYEKIRVGGKFSKLIENLEILKKHKQNNKEIHYTMNVVLMSINYDKISDIVDFAIKYKFDFVNFLKCNNYPQKDKSLLLSDEQICEIYEQINKKQSEIPSDFRIVVDNPFYLDVKNNIEDNKLNINFNNNGKDNNYSEKAECKNIEISKINNKYNNEVYCEKPWKLMMIDNRTISFGCQCRFLSLSKHYISKEDIWNCDEMINYRKSIVEKRENACKIFLENDYK